MINLIDVWWHVMSTYGEYHWMESMVILGKDHHYCNCGYKKPKRIRVRIK